MTGNVSQRDMRIQRAIEADARLRELPMKAVNWPHPDKPRGERMKLKAIHWRNPETEALIEAAKETTERDVA